MGQRAKKEKQVKTEIERCVLMSETDKKYWLKLIASLPEIMLDTVYKTVKSKNNTTDKYTRVALAENRDEDILGELKKMVQTIIKQAFEIEEKENQKDSEAELTKDLKDINQ